DSQKMHFAHAVDYDGVAVRHLGHPLRPGRGGRQRDDEHGNDCSDTHVASVLKKWPPVWLVGVRRCHRLLPGRRRSMTSTTTAPPSRSVTRCAISLTDGNALATATARPHARRKVWSFSASPIPTTRSGAMSSVASAAKRPAAFVTSAGRAITAPLLKITR